MIRDRGAAALCPYVALSGVEPRRLKPRAGISPGGTQKEGGASAVPAADAPPFLLPGPRLIAGQPRPGRRRDDRARPVEGQPRIHRGRKSLASVVEEHDSVAQQAPSLFWMSGYGAGRIAVGSRRAGALGESGDMQEIWRWMNGPPPPLDELSGPFVVPPGDCALCWPGRACPAAVPAAPTGRLTGKPAGARRILGAEIRMSRLIQAPPYWLAADRKMAVRITRLIGESSRPLSRDRTRCPRCPA